MSHQHPNGAPGTSEKLTHELVWWAIAPVTFGTAVLLQILDSDEMDGYVWNVVIGYLLSWIGVTLAIYHFGPAALGVLVDALAPLLMVIVESVMFMLATFQTVPPTLQSGAFLGSGAVSLLNARRIATQKEDNNERQQDQR